MITLLATLGAHAQLRRIDGIEARLLSLEQRVARCEATIRP